jgi:AcrR family transcriptional regulator
MSAQRPYSMSTRSTSTARTKERILHAVLELSTEKLSVEIVLADVAARSGVTVQTILRHFGSRDGLFDAAVTFATAEVVAEREAPVGDIPEAVRVIVDHYEARGDWVLSLLGQETTDARIRGITVTGKAVHRRWVQTVFEPFLSTREAGSRTETVDLLVVATDVYAWKLTRRDAGRSRVETELRMLRLIRAILESPPERTPHV